MNENLAERYCFAKFTIKRPLSFPTTFDSCPDRLSVKRFCECLNANEIVNDVATLTVPIPEKTASICVGGLAIVFTDGIDFNDLRLLYRVLLSIEPDLVIVDDFTGACYDAASFDQHTIESA